LTSGRPLRVLHAVKGLGPGGAERLLCAAAAARDRDAFDYEVAYVLPWKDHVVPQLTASGVRVHCVGRGAGRVRPVLDPRWAVRLRGLLRTRNYDVVHVHSPVVAGVVRPIVRSLGRRRPALVSTEHNGWDTFSLPTRLLNGATYGLDDARFAVSDPVRSSVSSRYRDRVEVAVHGVRVDEVRAIRTERAAVRNELGIAADDIVVGTVANYLAQKAYPNLFAAAKLALDADPRLTFVAVGQGQLKDEIEAEHANYGFGDRFRLLGYRADAVRVLAGCDIFTLASHFEGLPVALMEALALGLPVAVTAVGGIPDTISDGTEGLLVPPGQPDRLAAAVLAVAGDQHSREKMAAAAYRRGSEFDISRAVRQVEAVYLRLADAAPSTAVGM
jgi:L-malate glycosyltransferase